MGLPRHSTLPMLAALGLVAAATLTPGRGVGGWHPGPPDPADLLLNIALFVPLGMAIRWRAEMRRARQASPLRFRFDPPAPVAQATSSAEPEARASGQQTPVGQASPLRVVVVAAFLVSLSIELAQLSLIPGRDSSPWDLAANVGGALLGASIPAHLITLPLIPAWLASAWLLIPAPPPTPVWWGQWSHQFGSPAPFSGTIRAVAFNGEEAPDQSLGDSVTALMRARYRTPPSVLAVHLAPPTEPSPGRVQVAGIADGAGGEVVGLWQSGWDLELRWHARGTRWGLRHPAVRAPGLLEGLPQPEARTGVSLGPGHVFVEITSSHSFGAILGPWEGWRLFWPVDPLRPGPAMLMSVLWTAVCLGVPLMLWLPSLLDTRRKPQ